MGGRVPGEGFFRLLLRAHPRRFRERHEEEMLRYFREAWRVEARDRGVVRRVLFWLRMTRGTLRTAIEQRWTGRPWRRGAPAREDGSRFRDVPGYLRYALRSLRRQPAFAASVIVTLALGLGANAAVFEVLRAVVLAPLPYENPDRVVRLYRTGTGLPGERNYLQAPAFLHYRENAGSFAGLAAFYDYDPTGADLTDGDRPERVTLLPVSSDYFGVVGTEVMLGRSFRRSEERPEARIAVVSHDVWRRHLGGEPDAPGQRLTLDGETHTVVGVLPAGFRDPLHPDVDVWVPQNLVPGGYNHWDNYHLSAMGRLAPGVTLAQARAEIDALSRRQGELSSNAAGESGELVPLREDIVGEADTMLWLLWGAVGLLLVVACVNVANLFVARGMARERELAIRSALGSGRGRLVRHVLTESVLLSLAGGLAGVVLGTLLLQGMVFVAPPGIPRLDEVGFGAAFVAYATLLAIPAGLLFGAAPAIQAARLRIRGALTAGGRGRTEGPDRGRLRAGLVIFQVAVAMVLLIGGAVLGKSFHRLQQVDLGVEPEGVRVFRVHLPDARYGDAAERIRFHQQLHRRLAAHPDVRAAGAISTLPVTGESYIWGVRRWYDDGSPSEFYGANQRVVEGDYFRAVGLSLLQGRVFGPEDGPDDARVVVVNRALARRFFPGESAVGRTLLIAGADVEIIGVVEDPAVDPLGGTSEFVYHDHSQFGDNRNWEMHQVLAHRTPSANAVPAAREIVASLDPRLVVFGERSMDDVVGGGVAGERFTMLLLVTFAGIAGLLAAVGIYGVLAYMVSRRRLEFGLRVALGAVGSDVRRLVVRKGVLLAGAGALLGAPVALLLSGWLESFVHEVGVADPWIFGAAGLAMMAVAGAASWIPAWRATRVDPVEAFRAE